METDLVQSRRGRGGEKIGLAKTLFLGEPWLRLGFMEILNEVEL
jgi:hypothetical protein